jgi:hypothetical protein
LSGYITVLAALLITLVAPTAHASTACGIVYTISPQNSSNFGAAITISNTGTTALSGWSLTWTFANGQTVASSWNGAVSQSGANVTVSQQAGQTWENIPAGGSYSGFGFNGTWNGVTNSVPTNFAVNGVVCSGSSTLTSTTTTLASSSTSTTAGASVILTAKVAPSAATGTITFYDGATWLGTGTLSAGTATLTTSFSTTGTHSITAVYGGSTTDATSTSNAVSIAVTAGSKTATTTSLSSSATTVATGAGVTLTAKVAPSAATGTVTFYDGGTALGTGTLSAGTATLSTSFSTAGTQSITAAYGGSTTYAASTSSAVSISVTSSSSCSTTNPIVPYISVAGVWSAAGESSVTVAFGTAIDLGPQPVSGGSWLWSGPSGFTSTSREIDNIALSTGANVYTATYTNNGCSYKQAFTITVTVASAGQKPCDIFASDGHACVAAYSSTRALFADYNGHLYQVHRASDSTYLDITTSSEGGYANAAAQNSFCANTTCTITKIYDQTTNQNDLSVAGGGAEVPAADSPVSATGQAVSVGGNNVWGIYLNPGEGYRNDNTKNMPINADPEGAYEVASGTHFDQYCCFDFGNAEVGNGYPSSVNPAGGGEGHMDAINFSSECWFVSCPGKGPWVQVDVECCGLLGAAPTNPNDTGLTSDFITAYLRNEGVGNYYLDGGDATVANGNASFYAGPLPSGYSPMHQEGAILLGVGGDNSDWGEGTFFEGAITSGVYSNSALAAIQANVAAAKYALPK